MNDHLFRINKIPVLFQIGKVTNPYYVQENFKVWIQNSFIKVLIKLSSWSEKKLKFILMSLKWYNAQNFFLYSAEQSYVENLHSFLLMFFFLLNSEIFQVVIGEVSEQSVSHHENAEGINVQSTFFFFFFDCAVKWKLTGNSVIIRKGLQNKTIKINLKYWYILVIYIGLIKNTKISFQKKKMGKNLEVNFIISAQNFSLSETYSLSFLLNSS